MLFLLLLPKYYKAALIYPLALTDLLILFKIVINFWYLAKVLNSPIRFLYSSRWAVKRMTGSKRLAARCSYGFCENW